MVEGIGQTLLRSSRDAQGLQCRLFEPREQVVRVVPAAVVGMWNGEMLLELKRFQTSVEYILWVVAWSIITLGGNRERVDGWEVLGLL